MRQIKNIFGALFLFACVSSAFGQLTILSGSKQSTYYRYIQDIADIVGPSLDFKILNQESKGVAYNFSQLIDPNSPYKVGIIQSDYLYYMETQDMRLNSEKTKNLKVIFPLGYAEIHLVTKASKGYKDLRDLNNKIVAIGSNEQGTYTTASLIKERSKVNWQSRNIHFDDSFGALNTDKIDAFFIVGSAPIKKLDVKPETMVDKLALVPLVNFNDWATYYKPDTIRKTEYQWMDKNIPTFSVRTLLVVNESKLSQEERTNIIKLRSVTKDKYEQLKVKGHPKWKETNLYDWNETDWPYFK